MPKRIGGENFQAEIRESSLPVLAEFYSDSCIPCKRLAPVLGQIEDDYDGRLKVVKINIQFDLELAQTYKVMSSPTLVLFKDGQEKERIKGVTTQNVIVETIKQYL